MLSSNMISYLVGGKILGETKNKPVDEIKQENKLTRLINSVNAKTYKNCNVCS